MGAELDKLIRAYAKDALERVGREEAADRATYAEMEKGLFQMVRQTVKTEILAELDEEEIANREKRISEELTRRSTQKALQDAKNVIIEGIILAFFVGLLVNQSTDIITYLKTGGGPFTPTLWIITAIVVGLWVFVALKLVSTVSSLLNRKDG